MNWNLYLNFLAAMIAIVNPLGLLPLWSELTDDLSLKASRRTAFLIISTAFGILLVFMLAGGYILSFFSIQMPVFKISGGILLIFTGLSMVNGRMSRLEKGKIKEEDAFLAARFRFRQIVVPMAIPMLSGPGSITTVLLYGNSLDSSVDYFVLPFILFVVMLSLYLIFYFAPQIERKSDPLIFNVMTRIFGILVVAIAVQFIAEGISEVFPVLKP